jgi:DNA-binding transcriptional MerR regulator
VRDPRAIGCRLGSIRIPDMNSPNALDPVLAAVDKPDNFSASAEADSLHTIGELAKQFKLSLRTLRFYESQGLLSPRRQGRRRVYGRDDADRLAVILKAKKLGLTLGEIRQMIAGQGSQQMLLLSRERCLAQIGVLECKLAEIEEALAELRSMYASF